MEYTIDPSSIEKFDTSQLPSKRKLNTIRYSAMAIYVSLPLFFLVNIVFLLPKGLDVFSLDLPGWAYAAIFVPWFIAMPVSFITALTYEQNNEFRNTKVERGIVTAIDPVANRICLKGYTLSNVFTESWRVVSREVRESAVIGHLVDPSKQS